MIRISKKQAKLFIALMSDDLDDLMEKEDELEEEIDELIKQGGSKAEVTAIQYSLNNSIQPQMRELVNVLFDVGDRIGFYGEFTKEELHEIGGNLD